MSENKGQMTEINENAKYIGKKAESSTVVSADNTAVAVGSGSLEVFATPMMIALMENAAAKCLESILAEGQTSVGTMINAAHTAASPVGMKITAKAEITAFEGRKVDFEVAAFDEAGEIGKGSHSRFIVDSAKFMGKVLQKGNK